MRGHTLAGIIIISIGLSALFGIHLFNFVIALIILWIGVRVMMGKNHSFGNVGYEIKGVLNEDFLHRVLVFSGIRAKLKTENFEGMDLVTIFGGGEIDAGSVGTKRKDIDIDLVAIFGGIKLRIPKNWNVKSEGTGILGGYDNKTDSPSKSSVTIHLKGVAIFGGVEVVN